MSQESKSRVEQVQQQLTDQEAALEHSQKLSRQLSDQLSLLQQELSAAQTAHLQMDEVHLLTPILPW